MRSFVPMMFKTRRILYVRVHYCPVKKKDNAISYLKIDSYGEIIKNRFENVSSNLIILRETTKAQDESREDMSGSWGKSPCMFLCRCVMLGSRSQFPDRVADTGSWRIAESPCGQGLREA